MVTKLKVLFSHTEVNEPLSAVFLPEIEPLKVCSGLAEEFKLHLLELTGTECKVTGSDLVSERLTDLANTERKLFTGRTLNCGEVYENTLSRFRS